MKMQDKRQLEVQKKVANNVFSCAAVPSSNESLMPRYLLQTSDCQCRLEAVG